MMSTEARKQSIGPGIVAGSLSGMLIGALAGWLTHRWSLMGLGMMMGAGIGLSIELLRDQPENQFVLPG